jgi:hypothetical protein
MVKLRIGSILGHLLSPHLILLGGKPEDSRSRVAKDLQ